MDSQPGVADSSSGLPPALPVTFTGVTMGNTVPNQQNVQVLMLRPPGPQSARLGGASMGQYSSPLPRINGAAPSQGGLSPRYITIAAARAPGQANTMPISVVRNGQITQMQATTSSGIPGNAQIYLVSPVPTQQRPGRPPGRPPFKPPSGFSMRLPAATPTYVTPAGQNISLLNRGRKPMSEQEKQLQAKQQRVQPNGVPKKRQRRKKKDVAPAVDYTSEINDLKQKIHGRYEKHKKPNVKKEDVGYFGPYVKTYRLATAGGLPVPNAIVDTFEAHLDIPETNKTRFQLEKPKGMALEGPFVCHFCHFDSSAERDVAMGDLIGPIAFPVTPISHSRKHEAEESPGFYTHEKCMEWASNFRMIGFDIVGLETILQDTKTACCFCKRKGATIGCSAPGRCKLAFHYPCAKLHNEKRCKMVPGSHQIFCEDHMDVIVKHRFAIQPAAKLKDTAIPAASSSNDSHNTITISD